MEKLADISAFTELENGRDISSCFNWMPPAAARRNQNTGVISRGIERIAQDRNRYIKAANAPALAAKAKEEEAQKAEQAAAEEARVLQSNIQGALIRFTQSVMALGDKRFIQVAKSLQSAIAHAQQTKDARFAVEPLNRTMAELKALNVRLEARRKAVQFVYGDLVNIGSLIRQAHAKKLI